VVEVVGILVAAGDRQDSSPQDVGQWVDHPRRVARIGDQRRQPIADAELPLRRGKQHDPAIRGQPPAVKGSGHLLAADCRKAEGLVVSSCMAGVKRLAVLRVGPNAQINNGGRHLAPHLPARPQVRCGRGGEDLFGESSHSLVQARSDFSLL
jgi:hypothetical protein